MEYEQKYKKANEKVAARFGFNVAKEIFSDLYESEDERIRKWLIKDIRTAIHDGIYNGESINEAEKALAWLERQGKQKPADKVELKFKVGDWVVFNNKHQSVYQVEKIENFQYTLRHILGGSIPLSFSSENMLRLWTIQDAKDGDVLVMQKTDVTYESIFIFKKIENNCIIQYLHYFTTDAGEEVCEARSIDGFLGFVEATVYPATKEQRDTLEKAMTDAGYTFDFKKKELKKIEDEEYNGEDYGIGSLYHAQRILEKTLGKVDGYQSDDGILEHKCAITAVKKLYKQKPAWSEEDEKVIDCIEEILYSHLDYVKEDIRCTKRERKETKENFDKCIAWLKSLKERYTWKPSDEQIGALWDSIKHNLHLHPVLKSLYNDLKKLREE